MATPRTLTLDGAATIIRAKVNNAIAASVNEGGDVEDSRVALTRYFTNRQVESMLGNILADATTETPTDVRSVVEPPMRIKLFEELYTRARDISG